MRRANRPRCVELLFASERCRYPTFRDGKQCRLHRVSAEFRADLMARGRFVPIVMMFGAAMSLSALVKFGVAARALPNRPLTLWIMAAQLGWSLALLGDAMNGREGPFARLLLWPRLLVLGIAVALAGSVGSYARVTASSPTGPVLGVLLGRPAGELAVPLVAAVCVLSSVYLITLFVRRVLFYTPPPYVTSFVVWPTALGMILGPFRPLLERAGWLEARPETLQAWSAVLGGRSMVWLGALWFVAFNLCEFINIAMRRRRLDQEGFEQTIWPSYPVCAGTPMFAILAARFVLGFVALPGLFPVAVFTVAVSAILCVVGTGWVIRHLEEERAAARARQMGLYEDDAHYWRTS